MTSKYGGVWLKLGLFIGSTLVTSIATDD